MAAHYSILSVLIRPEIQEKISVGFLLIEGEDIFFGYSKNKLSISKALLSDNAYKSLKDALHNIQETANAQHLKDESLSFGFGKENTFTKSYIEYLSRYNNNILSFTSPKEIEITATQDVFSALYRKFVDNSIITIKEHFLNSIEKFKLERHEILARHFDIDREITHKEVDKLIVPVTVTFIGQNEKPTFIQSLDLEKRTDLLVNDISEILFLQKAFKESGSDSVAMAITNEPNKKEFPKQHDIWNQLRNTKDIKNYDVSEVEEVIQYAEKHGVKPYLKVA